MKWLYLHFPQLQLDGLLQNGTDKKHGSLPRAVIDIRQNRICQINDAAQEQHVECGMGLATAAALCHHLQIHDYQPELEQQRLQELAQWLYLVCAEIVLFPVDGLLLEINSMLKLHQGLDNYWKRIQLILQKQQVCFIACCGRTPLEARILARAGIQLITLEDSVIEQHIQTIDIAELGLKSTQLEPLQRIGIRQLKQLFNLPQGQLRQALGLEIIQFLQCLQGERPQKLDTFRPPAHFSRTLILHYETDNREALRFPLNKLLGEMEHYLRLSDRQTQEVHICLKDRDHHSHSMAIHSAQPEARSETWLQLVSLKLENLILKQPVISLTLRSGVLLEPRNSTPDLFSNKSGTLQPNQLISLLQARLGRDQVHGLRLYQDYRPECASDYAPCFTHSDIPAEDLPLIRPLLLLPQPEPLTQQVSLCSEPERIQSSWWLNGPVCRDYFIAETREQQCLWVFRDQRGQWFLHGRFG